MAKKSLKATLTSHQGRMKRNAKAQEAANSRDKVDKVKAKGKAESTSSSSSTTKNSIYPSPSPPPTKSCSSEKATSPSRSHSSLLPALGAFFARRERHRDGVRLRGRVLRKVPRCARDRARAQGGAFRRGAVWSGCDEAWGVQGVEGKEVG